MKTSFLFGLGATTSTLAAILEPLHARQSNWTIGQTVNTTSGPVSGHPGSNASAVSEYLGIPFAQPPLGDLRFAAPQAFNGTAAINGTSYGFSCPVVQGSSRNASVYAAANITSQGLTILAALGQIGQTFSEDCLTLNVWTKPQTGDAKKAVLVWIYGGGFASGSSSSVQYNGQNIADQEDVIVVSFNYRINVFGFPGNPAGTNNLGLLDQRLAVEWVRDNIEGFGGDVSRITIFGQSAGGASVDYYNYAWVDDPIVAGFIPESGTVFSFGLPNQAEFSASAWFNLTTNLGCGNSTSDAATVLACARTKNTTEVLDAIPPSSGTQGVLGYFGPTIDNTVVFSNYTARSAAGNFTKKPLLIGNNNYEAGLFVTTFALQGLSFPPIFWDVFNLQEFTCPAGIRANASVANNVPTWRYRYFGDFPDLTLAPGSGAWHGSELSLLFDVTPTSPPATDAEIAIGNYMRGAWAAFAKDPVNGLNNYEGGWPQYVPGQETLIRLAYDNVTGTNLASPYTYDAGCSLVNVSSTDTHGFTGNSTSTGSASGTSSGAVTTPTKTSGSGKINVSLVGGLFSALVLCLLLYI